MNSKDVLGVYAAASMAPLLSGPNFDKRRASGSYRGTLTPQEQAARAKKRKAVKAAKATRKKNRK